jgi:streptomycin 6-kinase
MLAGEDGGAEWLARLPQLVRECAQGWSLVLGEPYGEGVTSVCVRATSPTGGPAVLKVAFPHEESEHEADALRAWSGVGAVRLLDADPDSNALLLERCEPGTPLSTLEPDDALDVAAALIPRLWVPAGEPFERLEDAAQGWIDHMTVAFDELEVRFDAGLLEEALDALRDLAPAQGEQVLVSQDLHAGNILSAEREPWLAIDPKPLVGEREFSVAALIRGRELGTDRSSVWWRFDRLTGELGLDRSRVRGWAIAHTLAWGFDENGYDEEMIRTAGWMAEL